MTDLREKLAAVICESRAVDNTFALPCDYDLADAIIAALPGMVKPLEWKSIDAEPPKSGTFFVAIPSDGSGARLYVAVDADENGGVDILDCEDHEIQDVDDIFLSGAVWAEAPQEIVEPFFLRDA